MDQNRAGCSGSANSKSEIRSTKQSPMTQSANLKRMRWPDRLEHCLLGIWGVFRILPHRAGSRPVGGTIFEFRAFPDHVYPVHPCSLPSVSLRSKFDVRCSMLDVPFPHLPSIYTSFSSRALTAVQKGAIMLVIKPGWCRHARRLAVFPAPCAPDQGRIAIRTLRCQVRPHDRTDGVRHCRWSSVAPRQRFFPPLSPCRYVQPSVDGASTRPVSCVFRIIRGVRGIIHACRE